MNSISLWVSIVCLGCASGAGMDRDGGRHDAHPIDAPMAHDAGDLVDGHVDPRDASVDLDGGIDGHVDGDGGTGLDSGIATDAGHGAGHDAGPPATPGPGTYRYRRVAIGGMTEGVAVAFHPDGSYAIVLERTNFIRVYDWASDTTTRIDRTPSGRTLYLSDVVFSADGTTAWIVGTERTSTADEAVVFRFDDASWRAGDLTMAVRRLSDTRAGERFMGIEYPIGPGHSGTGLPVVLSQSGTSSYIARLRELDPSTETFTGLVTAQATSAGCDDLAFVNNEFGTWGIVLVCGSGGADAPYYTEIGGVGTWRAGPSEILGNASRAASYPSGAYALGISSSGFDIDRFEGGAWRSASTAPGFPAIGIWDVSFSPDGRRALIVGRAGGTSLSGSVLEYRHDLWSTSAITNVSIPSFGVTPYLGDSNTYLNDSAFRPGCEGGLIVGGKTDFSSSTGMLIEFSIEGGTACR